MKSECHVCNQTVQNLAKCAKTRCRNFFCEKCIQENFDSTFTYHGSYKDRYWICYACQNICSCKLCKGEVLIHNKKTSSKRFKKPEKQDSPTKDPSNNQEDSVENMSTAIPDEKSMLKNLNPPRIYSTRITKQLPTQTQDYHYNKFYRRKLLLKNI